MSSSTVDEEFKRCEKLMGEKRKTLSIPAKIEMYGLWCVATRGKCTRKQPSRASLLEYGKYRAWKKYDSMSQDDAKKKFIERAKALLESKL